MAQIALQYKEYVMENTEDANFELDTENVST